MSKKECIAMLLAGGQGSRLGALTQKIAKPAVSFGGKFRIIDFSLSNCSNSGIDTVGVLTQYRPYLLHAYVGSGEAWDLDSRDGGVSILPPYETQTGGAWYAGTADAITQNLDYIKANDPKYVLILSGDHLYRMDYRKMLKTHIENNADLTVSVMPVPWEEASRFGIMNTDEDGRINEFEEKPAKPKSNLASMGIYVFNTEFLKSYLEADAKDTMSSHDFGKNIIPKMLADKARLYSYAFDGYWKDVGTIESLWQANMDLLQDQPPFSLDDTWRIYSSNLALPPHYLGSTAKVHRSMINEGSMIFGEVENSVIFPGVRIGKGAQVKNSVILPFTTIAENARVDHAIVAQNCEIAAGAQVAGAEGAIAVVPEGETVLPADGSKQVG